MNRNMHGSYSAPLYDFKVKYEKEMKMVHND